MKHVINRLTFELSCSSEQQAFGLRDKFYDEYYDGFLAVIEDSCNQIVDREQLIRLEKLEINFGAFANQFTEKQQYFAAFKKAFEQELKAKVCIPFFEKTIPQSHLDSLEWFLTMGTLPWWIKESDVDLEKWCIELQLKDSGDHFIDWLLQRQNDQQTWKRIVFQLASSFKSFIVAAIPELKNAGIRLKELLPNFLQQKKIDSTLQSISTYEINDFVLADAPSFLNAELTPSDEIVFQKFLKYQLSSKEINVLPAEIYNEIFMKKNALTEPNEDDRNDSLNKNLLNIVFEGLPNHSKESKLVKYKTENAGIILIAAFLPVFFNRIGVWVDGKWTNEAAVDNAVLLLHYLATGSDAPFEYELSFEKIICGLPINWPLNSRLSLLTTEKHEADELLASIVEHWAALKNTSISGFRQAFLQRDGLLSGKGDNWLLEVEKKTIDVLMEQIPWGYGTLMLPWNKYMICTEW